MDGAKSKSSLVCQQIIGLLHCVTVLQ